MKMMIWLTAKAVADNNGKIYGATVNTSNQSGGKYITMYLDPVSPAVDMPRFKRGDVKLIALTETYHEGFRPEGIYVHKGAKAMVKTEVKVDSPYAGNNFDTTSIERRQEISVSAKSIVTLKAMYTMIRQGKLEPTEKWSDGGQSGVSFAETDHNGF